MAGSLTASRPLYARRSRGAAKATGVGRPQIVEIQRARVLAATFEVLSKRGAGNVSVGLIVARSGMSRRTFYELFESREDCYLAAFNEALDLAAARVFDAWSSEGKWQSCLRAGLVALLGFLEEEPAVGRVLVVESLSAGPKTLERRSQVLEQLARVIDEARTLSASAASLPPLTADGLVGGALSVIHAHMTRADSGSLLDLTNQLMSMIVLPYLGVAAARGELDRPVSSRIVNRRGARPSSDPFKDAGMRLTYRTVRVLLAIAEHPSASNRTIGDAADIRDQGQISKLLSRLQRLELISNTAPGSLQGAPNAWSLTTAGQELLKSFHNATNTEAPGDTQ